MKIIDQNEVKQAFNALVKNTKYRPMSGNVFGCHRVIPPSPRQVRRKLERLRKAELRKQLKKKQ